MKSQVLPVAAWLCFLSVLSFGQTPVTPPAPPSDTVAPNIPGPPVQRRPGHRGDQDQIEADEQPEQVEGVAEA